MRQGRSRAPPSDRACLAQPIDCRLAHTVKADGLVVVRMIGMHMSPTPWSALFETLKTAGAAA